MLGRVLLASGRPQEAIRELELAAELKPDSVQTRFHLARAYRQAGRMEDAGREQSEFLRLSKDPGAVAQGVEAGFTAEIAPNP